MHKYLIVKLEVGIQHDKTSKGKWDFILRLMYLYNVIKMDTFVQTDRSE